MGAAVGCGNASQVFRLEGFDFPGLHQIFKTMEIFMLSYPSIPGWKKSRLGEPCLAFYKYDGSNLRWEWTPKKEWHKFGTRNQLFDASAKPYGDAIPIFQEQLGPDIAKIVCDASKNKVERIIAFTEFFGPSSFAGYHDSEEKKQLVLIDVSVYKKGFIEPRQFRKMFGDKEWTAKVIYEGNMNSQFIEDVRHGAYPVYEGVVCKGNDWVSKIKTFEYLNRLKNRFGDDWEKYAE